MGTERLGFEDFIGAVGSDHREFVNALHQVLYGRGCKVEVKLAKSGYVVSYLFDKKTISNYVFRKAGVMVRIYANHVMEYMDFLETLPEDMVRTVQAAQSCKRLANPGACNPKCSMGYDFLLRGERHQKCRNTAFQFYLCENNYTFIKGFLQNEVEARGESG